MKRHEYRELLLVILAPFLAVGSALLFTACDSAQWEARRRADERTAIVYQAETVKRNMIFFRHPGSGLCFAFANAEPRTDRVWMAAVPCDSIPAELLK